MKKKIIIGSIFAALLMLSMPVIPNIQAQPVPATTPVGETDDCNICPAKKLGWNDDICDMFEEMIEEMDGWEEMIKNGEIYYPWGAPAGPGIRGMFLIYIQMIQGFFYFFYAISGCLRSD